MDRPVVFTSQFPPSERTFRGAVMMRLASGGADADELVEDFTELAGDFAEHFPDDAPIDPSEVPAVVDEVIAEYQRVVTTMSPDAVGLMESLDALLDAGILYSYGDAYEPSDAMAYLEEAFEAVVEAGGRLQGFLYSLVGDLDELVLDQRLEVAFGTFDATSSGIPALALEAVRVFTEHGLKASWSGDVDEPIVIEPIVVDAPLVADDDEPAHSH